MPQTGTDGRLGMRSVRHRRRTGRWAGLLLALLLLAAGGGADARDRAADAARAQPEPPTPLAAANGGSTDPREQPSFPTPATDVARERSMIVTANPLATEAGERILESGGSAADAAIAAALVLGLVEPQSSGLGGGGFALALDAASGRIDAFDGRETAPLAAVPQLFLDPASGAPLGFREAALGGLAVGAPGLAAMLERLHGDHGRLPWAELVAPAIALARDGFTVSPRLHALLSAAPALQEDPAAAALYFPGGTALAAGDHLANPALAETLERLAAKGAAIFAEGPLAEAIVASVRSSPNPGLLGLKDLSAYRAKLREPVCMTYRSYRVCGMGPPSSGGIAVLQMLGILAHFDLARLRPEEGRWHPSAAHLLLEAGRLAFADRNLYLADSDFVPVPVAGLLDPGYLAGRAALIGFDALPEPVPAGEPPADQDGTRHGSLWPLAPSDRHSRPSTTHLNVVDAEGNAVAMTNSIETAFGAHRMVGGFLLNNQLTDFSFRPALGLRPVANRVEPGKRPRSSMAPTLVFDEEGALVAMLGSPGGSTIIAYTATTLVALLDWGLSPAEAVNLPHLAAIGGPAILEAGPHQTAIAHLLEAKGHALAFRPMTSGLAVVLRSGEGWLGAADPRREGRAGGR